MYIEGLLLDCIDRIKTNRSVFGIYHVITGKKSIQSVHDARLFQVEKYYGIYQSFSRQSFINTINKMTENGWLIKLDTDGFYEITLNGKQILNKYLDTSIYNSVNGLAMSGKDHTFLERLYLLVQTYSNIQSNYSSFIPVIDNQDISNWVKNFYRNNRNKNTAKRLYEELHHLFSSISSLEANFFVDRLSGYRHYGMSMNQLAKEYELTIEDANILLLAITHHLLALIENNIEKYSILSQLIQISDNSKFITKTAHQTYQLLKNQGSIEDIARKRNLKINTIYDHIVEIALYDSKFDILGFVSLEEQEEIIKVVRKKQTLKLKTIKENCRETISYFQIRLVLTRLKGLLPEEEGYV
ncbi:helix-turn-helix domain-containing protein [Ornithinibacillus sp. 179-J 7C1 HS]|uniref:helix-turn-helix domain-containing protein n=1 Tax=Ornithinibacillus sp. 179-J 7C1 HS TaxID=3142384 RepID=UPI0039A2C2D3